MIMLAGKWKLRKSQHETGIFSTSRVGRESSLSIRDSTHCTRRQFLHCFPRVKFDLTDISFVSNSAFSPVLKRDNIGFMDVSHEPRYAFHAFSCHQYYVPVQIVVLLSLIFKVSCETNNPIMVILIISCSTLCPECHVDAYSSDAIWNPSKFCQGDYDQKSYAAVASTQPAYIDCP